MEIYHADRSGTFPKRFLIAHFGRTLALLWEYLEKYSYIDISPMFPVFFSFVVIGYFPIAYWWTALSVALQRCTDACILVYYIDQYFSKWSWDHRPLLFFSTYAREWVRMPKCTKKSKRGKKENSSCARKTTQSRIAHTQTHVHKPTTKMNLYFSVIWMQMS